MAPIPASGASLPDAMVCLSLGAESADVREWLPQTVRLTSVLHPWQRDGPPRYLAHETSAGALDSAAWRWAGADSVDVIGFHPTIRLPIRVRRGLGRGREQYQILFEALVVTPDFEVRVARRACPDA